MKLPGAAQQQQHQQQQQGSSLTAAELLSVARHLEDHICCKVVQMLLGLLDEARGQQEAVQVGTQVHPPPTHTHTMAKPLLAQALLEAQRNWCATCCLMMFPIKSRA